MAFLAEHFHGAIKDGLHSLLQGGKLGQGRDLLADGLLFSAAEHDDIGDHTAALVDGEGVGIAAVEDLLFRGGKGVHPTTLTDHFTNESDSGRIPRGGAVPHIPLADLETPEFGIIVIHGAGMSHEPLVGQVISLITYKAPGIVGMGVFDGEIKGIALTRHDAFVQERQSKEPFQLPVGHARGDKAPLTIDRDGLVHQLVVALCPVAGEQGDLVADGYLQVTAHDVKIGHISIPYLFEKPRVHKRGDLLLHVGHCHTHGHRQLLGGRRIVAGFQQNVLGKHTLYGRPRQTAVLPSCCLKAHLLGFITFRSKFSCHIHSLLEKIAGAEQTGFHRALGLTQGAGDIPHRSVLDVVGHHHLAVVPTQKGQLTAQDGHFLVVGILVSHRGGSIIPACGEQILGFGVVGVNEGLVFSAAVTGLGPQGVAIARDLPYPCGEVQHVHPLVEGGEDLVGNIGRQLLGLVRVARLAEAVVEDLAHVLLPVGFGKAGLFGVGHVPHSFRSYSVGKGETVARKLKIFSILSLSVC